METKVLLNFKLVNQYIEPNYESIKIKNIFFKQNSIGLYTRSKHRLQKGNGYFKRVRGGANQ
tara:strand:- start:1688 stop:1873 length:186 start_codon:yes stop_codon:yes gene_type:complete